MLTYNLNEKGKQPLYLFISECIKTDIKSGKIIAKEKLPSKRALSEHLGVSVITIETAYDTLISEGYVYSVEKSGYYVSESGYIAKPFSSVTSQTSIEEKKIKNRSPFPYAVWCKLLRKVASDYGDVLLERIPHDGCEKLKLAIANFLYRYRGLTVSADNIIIGAGAEYLYGLISQLLGKTSSFLIEKGGYEKIEKVYKSLGVNYYVCDCNANGEINLKQAEKYNAEILHVSPSHNFLTNTWLGAPVRQNYVSWAKQEGRYIIEDDFDSELNFNFVPLETLFSMDKLGKVIYLNTFSSTIAPSLRVGYMILPEKLKKKFDEELDFYSCTVPAFEQYVLAEFIDGGYFERHIARLRKLRKNSKFND